MTITQTAVYQGFSSCSSSGACLDIRSACKYKNLFYKNYIFIVLAFRESELYNIKTMIHNNNNKNNDNNNSNNNNNKMKSDDEISENTVL